MSEVFSPDTPLARAVHAGDYAAVVALFKALSPAERPGLRASALKLAGMIQRARFSYDDPTHAGWGRLPTDAQTRAIGAAVLLCGTAKDVADHVYQIEDVVALAKEFHPPSIAGLADAWLKRSPGLIGRVQALIAAGLVERPQTQEYGIGLIALPGRWEGGKTIDEAMAADPGLRDVLLSVMDVEGTQECNLSAVDKYSSPDSAWSAILLGLCRRGVYSRATLIDRTLSSLERDWPQFRAGWFSRFHAALAPTADEMQPHVRRYLALCGSRIPPTVTFALDAVRTLQAAGLVAGRELLDALRPVLSASGTGQVGSALKLIDAAVAAEGRLAPEAASIIVNALAHERADVQKLALQRLQRWGVDQSLRERLQELSPLVAAVNRPLLEVLVGSPSPPAGSIVAVTSRGRSDRQDPLAADRRLEPIDDVRELVERVAYVFENDTDIDEFERAAAAVVRLAPFDADSRRSLGPVVKRAAKVRTPVASQLARLLLYAVDGSPLAVRADGSLALGHLSARIDALISQVAGGRGLEPLSTPTHRRGFIHPSVLVARVASYQAAGLMPAASEQVLGLLRLATGRSEPALADARVLEDSQFTRALRYALGDDVAPGRDVQLFAAAARIRHPGADDVTLLASHGDLGPDGATAAKYSWRIATSTGGTGHMHRWLEIEPSGVPIAPSALLAVQRHPAPRKDERWWIWPAIFSGTDEAVIRYAATLVPSSPDAVLAEGARVIGGNLDWWEARWQNRAYLQLLSDPTIELTVPGTLLLAAGLAGKEPGQTALAVDALVAAVREGRVDVPRLGGMMRDLVQSSLAKNARYARSLQAVLRIDPMLSPCVIGLIVAMLEASPDEPPRDTALLLSLLHETVAATGVTLTEPSRSTVSRLKLSGKARAVQRALLER